MHFVRYTHAGTPPAWGVTDGEAIHPLAGRPEGEPTLGDLANPSYRRSVRRTVENGGLPAVPAADVSLLAPVPRPGKVVGIGLNYHDHAEEQDADLPDQPLLFGKAPTAVTNPGDPIVRPPGIEQVDYEVELGVVIGRTATGVDEADAREYVAGYTVVNDVSARDAQFADRQWFRGKSYDTFAPMGPALVADGGFDPHDADVSLRVNGETKQESSTRELIFGIDELISFVSRAVSLRPGDVIATGTPGGVGVFRDPPDLLEPGDTVEAEVDGIGTLENPVVDG